MEYHQLQIAALFLPRTLPDGKDKEALEGSAFGVRYKHIKQTYGRRAEQRTNKTSRGRVRQGAASASSVVRFKT